MHRHGPSLSLPLEIADEADTTTNRATCLGLRARRAAALAGAIAWA